MVRVKIAQYKADLSVHFGSGYFIGKMDDDNTRMTTDRKMQKIAETQIRR